MIKKYFSSFIAIFILISSINISVFPAFRMN